MNSCWRQAIRVSRLWMESLLRVWAKVATFLQAKLATIMQASPRAHMRVLMQQAPMS